MSANWYKAVFPIAVASVACCLMVVTGVRTSGASPAPNPAPTSEGASIPTYQWPEAHGNPRLTGLSGDPSINTATAGQLGVRWMANMGSQSLTSPVVAYNQALGQTVVYAGTEGGWLTAYSELTGQTIWSVNIGTAIRSTPVVDGSSIWVTSTTARG